VRPITLRASLVALFVTGLIGLPARAASSRPLATVVSAQSAHLANTDAVPGADVYLDDDLVTEQDGSLRLAVGSGQVYLLGQSEATLRQDEDRIQAKMYRGTLGFSTSTPQQLEIDTPFGMVRGADGSRVLGQISILISEKTSAEKIVISSYQGTLVVVDKAGASKTIGEGQTYIGTMTSDAGGGKADVGVQGVGSSGTNWNHVAWVAGAAAAMGTVAAVLYVTASDSCMQPGCQLTVP
jgi:hypothetical protein